MPSSVVIGGDVGNGYWGVRFFNEFTILSFFGDAVSGFAR
jgi:hypothetical protein